MRHGRLDTHIEFAIEELASGDQIRIGSMVRRMAIESPNEPALSICFAVTNAASLLEEQFQETDKAVLLAYRFAALLAADIFAIETMGQIPATGHHLLQFWRRTDPYFLKL